MRRFAPVPFLLGLIVFALLGTGRLTGAEPSPKVVVGAEAFRTTPVNPLVGWVQSGVYDSSQGLEIAVLDYGKITFLDPKTFAAKRSVPVHDNQVGYKQLVSLRADGKLNLLREGGGYQDVGWFDLDEHLLWSFKSKSKYSLPPSKLFAADLDGDGTKEFYVADHEGVFRLDADGKVVWRTKNASLNYYGLTLPAEGDRPALVVTDGGMYDCHGKAWQQPVKTSVGTYMLQAVHWAGSSCLASGETSTEGGHVYLFDLTGKTIFEQTIGDWGVNDILAVRFKAGEPPYLVVVGGRGGSADMTEFSVFAHGGTLVYQEIRKGQDLLVIPDDAAGTDTLLLTTGGLKKFEKL